MKNIENQQPALQSGEVVLYNPDDTIRLEVRMNDETVWLSQAQMAELFGTQRQAITKHLKNIFESHELEKTATSSILELLQKEGMRMVRRQVELYNLDVIISVGYRVNTQRGIQFRQWALKILIDESTLLMLEKRNREVEAVIYTHSIGEKLQLDIDRHNAQYRPISVLRLKKSHDRFLVLDDDVYHIGASLKDLGKQWFAIMKMNEIRVEDILGRIS